MTNRMAWGLVGALVAVFALAGCKFNNSNGGTTYDGGFDGFAPQNPLLVASPASADFGTVNVGSKSATKTIVVANIGPGTTGALSVAVTGSDFTIDTDGCTHQSLATTGSCAIAVRFAPSTTGAESATVKISASPGGEADVAVSGTGAGVGSLAITPPTNDYGAVQTGSASAPFTFTVTNKGSAATGAVTVALTGSDAAQFALSADQCSGKTLAPLATCTVNVAANPTAPGSLSASLTAQAAGESGTATASLSANSLPGPTFVINPPSYGFGPVGENTPPVAGKTFTVQNVGAFDAGTPVLAVTGPNAQDFAIGTNMCTAGLGPSGTCEFTLTFAPTTATAESAIVTASATNAMSGEAAVSGTGLAPADITITPTTQPFAPILQGGQQSADVPFVVKNTGAVATGPLAASISGTNADQFGLGSDGCSGFSIAAGATCTVSAHFAPTATAMAGAVQASLQVTGMPGGQTAATLTATALSAAKLSVSPTSQPLGSVLQGAAGTDFPFVVSNAGDTATGPITVALSGAAKADFGLGMDGCTGHTLAMGASCTVYAHFAPGAASRGAESATLTVSATPGGSVPVTLTGTALAPALLSLEGPALPQWAGVGVGSVSGPVTFVVQNLGDQATANVLFQVIGDADAGDTAQDFTVLSPNPCGGPLPGGQACMFQVQFAPSTATGTETATLQATSTTGGMAQAPLEGNALWMLVLNVVNEPGGGESRCFPSLLTGATVGATDGSISCSIVNGASATCTALYSDGAQITLEQLGPTMGFGSLNWSGCAADPGTPCPVTISRNMTISADYCGNGG